MLDNNPITVNLCVEYLFTLYFSVCYCTLNLYVSFEIYIENHQCHIFIMKCYLFPINLNI